jgi:hypothetical protein
VVVTGFGRESKKSFAGAAKVVTGENISQKSFTNVSQALAGEAAGVNVIRTSGFRVQVLLSVFVVLVLSTVMQILYTL